MRVLVVESDPHSADRAIADLRARGHRVVRCHDADSPAFPCAALCENGVCALDRGGGVDVVVDYRAHAHPDPTAYEDGVSCALRRHIPLVVAGDLTPNPYGDLVSALATDDEIVRACEDVSRPSTGSLSEVALDKARDVLASDPDIAGAVTVAVTRDQGAIRAVVTLPDEAREVDGALAVAIAGALRKHDRLVQHVDVIVKRRLLSNRWEFRQ